MSETAVTFTQRHNIFILTNHANINMESNMKTK